LESEEWVPELAIIDVHLPAMNGIDLAVHLKARHPDVRVALLSGRAETEELVEASHRQGYDFDLLAKPVHPTVLPKIAVSLMVDPGQATDSVQ
jgi:DNA-binding NtrC family response regulator